MMIRRDVVSGFVNTKECLIEYINKNEVYCDFNVESLYLQ